MRMVVLAILAAILGADPAGGQRADPQYWIPEMTSQGNRLHSVLFVDASRIQVQEGNQRRAWFDLYFNPQIVGRGATRLLMFADVDCDARRTCALQSTTYFADGTHITDPADEDWVYPQPNSRGEAFVDFVCAGMMERANFATPIERARDPAEMAAVMFELGVNQ